MATHEEVLEHLGYEWWMFREAYELLRHAGAEHSATRNALVESLAIHGRVLTQFFYRPRRRSTDWNVESLGMTLLAHDQEPSELADWYDKTSQHVAHLTEHRVIALASLSARKVRELLATCIDRVKTELAAELQENWIGNRPTALAAPDDGSDSTSSFGPTGVAGPARGP